MNIFREYTENQKRAKDRIKREKDADKAKHDRMLDSARTRDTRRKNNMTESEIHVRLDHLDGDARQKKANDVMKKHEKAGHIKYGGSTDKGVIFKAKSKAHADRLHKDLKPHATGVEFSEEKSAQDPDIKDREGTQPAAYHKGLKKTTKAKRDAHFKKHGKKDDDDASAYKDAPGDKKARKGDMPKSKYTKFVDNMMKEGTDFAAHRAKPKLTSSDQKKMAKVADMLRKEREKKAAQKEEFGYSKEKRKPEPNPKIAALNKQLSARLKKEREQKAAMKKEEREEHQIDELSKKTMGSYVKKASQSAADHGMQAGRKQAERDEVDRSTNRHGNVDRDAVHKAFKTTQSDIKKPEQKAAKRLKGIHRAIGKLTKEEAQKKDHQTISYVTHGGQKGKVQVHKSQAFKALNHYRKNNKSAQFEEMSPESQKAHRNMFKAAQKKKDDSTAQAEREKRLKAKGWVKNDRGGMSKVSEAMGDAAHKAAVKHITDLGKKHGRTVGQQRMHIDNFPQKHDAKTRAAAKTINKNQFGGWKVGKDGKTTQEETGSYRKDSGWKKVDKKDKTPPMDKARQLAKKGQKTQEATGSYRKDSGWKKIDKKDKTSPMDKARELAKKGQKSVMKEDSDKSLSAKAAKSGISVGTLKKVYNRGVAAWKTGHRPGTTPSQWGHARVNAFITKKKKGGLNHDKDLA